MTKLETALHLAVKWHTNLYSARGRPYVLHCIRVMEQMDTEELQIIALLHDILEDTDCPVELLEKHFSVRVVDTIKLLTRRREEQYESYVRRLARDSRARTVKLADLEDNMRIVRLNEFGKKERKRLHLYWRAYHYLVKYLDSEATIDLLNLEEDDE